MAVKLFDNLALLLLLGLAAVRPIISERFDSALSGFGAAVTGISDPSPVRTVVFDMLILASALLWALARALGPDRRYRWTGLEIGTAVVLAAGMVACVFAGNVRLALNAMIDWACLPVTAIVLAQLLRRRWQRQVVVMIVISSALVQAWQILDYRLFGLDATWEAYVADKEEMWESKGVALDSPTVALFERRLLAGEAQGAFPHSNVASSYLVLCFFAALGIAVDRWRRTGRPVESAAAMALFVPVFALLAAVALTKSLGGIVSLGAGVGLLLLVFRFRRWIGAHRRRAFGLGLSAFALGVAAVVAYGMHHHSLPGSSLAFRWEYWTTSSRLVADHPWTGVGRENFGRNYLRYKPIESPEEVANPHNLFVQAATDWGVPGLVGIALLALGAVWTLSSPRDGEGAGTTSGAGHKPGAGRPLPWGVAGLVAVTLGRMGLSGVDDADWLYYQAVTTALVWSAGFLLVLWSFGGPAQVEPQDRRWGWESYVGIGLFTFFLHEMVNFATFVPGSGYTFFVLLGCSIAGRSGGARRGTAMTSLARWAPPAGVACALAAVGLVALVPVARADHHLRRARAASDRGISGELADHPTARGYELAGRADPLDPTPHAERVRWLMSAAAIDSLRDRAVALATESLQRAIARDPLNLKLRRMRWRLQLLRARSGDGAEHFDAAIDAAREVLELYPQNPSDIIALADVQYEAGRATDRRELVKEALNSYRRALALDDRRPAWEVLRRLPQRERRRITARLGEDRR